jgi:hypothetical protein
MRGQEHKNRTLIDPPICPTAAEGRHSWGHPKRESRDTQIVTEFTP